MHLSFFFHFQLLGARSLCTEEGILHVSRSLPLWPKGRYVEFGLYRSWTGIRCTSVPWFQQGFCFSLNYLINTVTNWLFNPQFQIMTALSLLHLSVTVNIDWLSSSHWFAFRHMQGITPTIPTSLDPQLRSFLKECLQTFSFAIVLCLCRVLDVSILSFCVIVGTHIVDRPVQKQWRIRFWYPLYSICSSLRFLYSCQRAVVCVGRLWRTERRFVTCARNTRRVWRMFCVCVCLSLSLMLYDDNEFIRHVTAQDDVPVEEAVFPTYWIYLSLYFIL